MNIREAVDGVIKYLSNLPKGTEISTIEVLEELGYFNIGMEDAFIIDSQVRKIAGDNGMILDDSSYSDQVTGLSYRNLYCIRAKDGKHLGIEKIDITKWLQVTYGEELNPAVVSVEFCQSSEEVWLNVEYGFDTEFGLVHRGESFYLDFAAEPYDEPLDIVAEGKSPYFEETFSPENDIEENVRRLVIDKTTLENLLMLIH